MEQQQNSPNTDNTNENAKKKLKLENINSSEGNNDNNSSTNNTNFNSNNNYNNNNNNNMNNNNGNSNNTSNNNNNSNSNNNDKPDQVKSKRVYVANVPFDVKWSELKDLFRDKVGNVLYCTIFENEDGKSRGCGLLEFQDQASAAKAIQVMHRFELKGRDLVVKEDLDCERDRFGRIVTNHGNNATGGSRSREDSQRRDGNNRDRGNRNNQQQQQQQQSHQQQHQQQQQLVNSDSYGYDHSVMSNSFGPSQHHNTYGLSQQFLDSLGIALPLNNRIFVANLEYKVDQNKLEEIFKLAGKVARVKLSHDSQGQSRGYGTVEYEHPVEAVQAISMFHNQKLYGRTMSVRMDKYECEDDIEALPSKLPSGLESVGKGLGVGGQPLNIAKSIMNAALVAPPHMTSAGQAMPQMLPQNVHQPAMQQAVIVAQMQQLQQQQQLQLQQQQQQAQQAQQPNPVVPQSLQQNIPRTIQHQMQQPLQQTLQQPLQQQLQQQQPQQYQLHQVSQTTQPQSLQPGSVQPQSMTVPGAYPQLHQLPNQGIRPPTSVYQQTPQQQAPPQAASSTPATNLSVYSTFERQFREASASRNL